MAEPTTLPSTEPLTPANAGDGQTILWVDDNRADMGPLMDAVSHYGFELLRATNVTEARLALESRCDDPALVIADYKLHDETAADVLECVTNLCGEVPFLVLSGEIRSGDTITLCGRELPLIHKPATPVEIVSAIARLTDQPPTLAD